jgi:hypothetical protein
MRKTFVLNRIKEEANGTYRAAFNLFRDSSINIPHAVDHLGNSLCGEKLDRRGLIIVKLSCCEEFWCVGCFKCKQRLKRDGYFPLFSPWVLYEDTMRLSMPETTISQTKEMLFCVGVQHKEEAAERVREFYKYKGF